jgi:hypothetical protein
MRTSEILYAIASWLESPENEAMLLAEHDEDCLNVVATSCVQAAEILKLAAEHTDSIEPEESVITEENISKLAYIANEFDNSQDPELVKQASLIDELLTTIYASKDAIRAKKAENEQKLENLKKKYQDTKVKQDKANHIEDMQKALDKSEYLKQYRPLQQSLQTRYCPDHPGVSLQRISDTSGQCSLDNKLYDFEAGYTMINGTKVPGTSVQEQTKMDVIDHTSNFSTRENRLGK